MGMDKSGISEEGRGGKYLGTSMSLSAYTPSLGLLPCLCPPQMPYYRGRGGCICTGSVRRGFI